jgi:hypothetical protein
MKAHWAYFRYVCRHKIFVFLAGLRLGAPLWQLIVHDWSKFTLEEWSPYVHTFYKADGSGQYKPSPAFDRAWNHHQKANPHHWQYHLLVNDRPGRNWVVTSPDGGMSAFGIANYQRGKYNLAMMDAPNSRQAEEDADWLCVTLNRTPVALEMPERYVREMVADWAGAGRALGKPDTRGWYEANKQNIILHPATRARVETLLGEL